MCDDPLLKLYQGALRKLDKQDGASEDYGLGSRAEARRMIADGQEMLRAAEARVAEQAAYRSELETLIAKRERDLALVPVA